tara:strand:+ start:549 stop:1124 length:576 start_codon:yes stop_codon:yes gene_type:complete
MPRKTFKTDQPVVLDGYQAVLKPSKYGHSLVCIIEDQDLIDSLEEDRTETLKWAESRLKNPRRSTLKPEPWEEVADGKYKVKFSWNEDNCPPIVDTEGTPVTDQSTPVYSGSTVKVGFYQKPYILKDGVTYGTTLKLLGAQLVSLESKAGVDSGDMSAEDVAAMFGNTKGFKQTEPNVVPKDEDPVDEDDF